MCGLCGNFDQRSSNDFTTRDHMVVDSELDFGNSWKEVPTCPDVASTPEPCSLNPHRRAWAEKQCSIIKGQVFHICHSKVGVAASAVGVAMSTAGVCTLGESPGVPMRHLSCSFISILCPLDT